MKELEENGKIKFLNLIWKKLDLKISKILKI